MGTSRGKPTCLPGDRILPLEEARKILEAELHMKGWSRTQIREKIKTGWGDIRWTQGVHYFCSGHGIVTLNCDAIIRGLRK